MKEGTLKNLVVEYVKQVRDILWIRKEQEDARSVIEKLGTTRSIRQI